MPNNIQLVEDINSASILELFSKEMTDLLPSNVITDIDRGGFPTAGKDLESNQYCFYRLKKLSFDEEYPRREAFENVLLSLDNEAFNFVYVIKGTVKGIELYLGVVKNANENKPVLDTQLKAVNYGENIAEVFQGNFNGSELEKLSGADMKRIMIEEPLKYDYAGVITGVPSVDETNGESKYDFQGIDRLVNTMLGQEWRMVLVCEPVADKDITSFQDDIFELYNRLSVWSKRNIQTSSNVGTSSTEGTNKSESKGESKGGNRSKAEQHGTNKSSGETWGSSNSSSGTSSSTTLNTGENWGSNTNKTEGSNFSKTVNKGISKAVTVEWANKCVQEMMKYIDDELLGRIKTGLSKGLFKTTVYYMANEPIVANRLKSEFMAIFQGNNPSYSALKDVYIDLKCHDERNRKLLNSYQSSYMDAPVGIKKNQMTLLSRPIDYEKLGMCTFLTSREISLLAGMPQKEVPGLILKQAADFGLNEKTVKEENSLKIGSMIQKGRVLEKVVFTINREDLAKHTFVAGVTGSGKTTTCQKILVESGMPFMVIEPVKREYRVLLNNNDIGGEIIVFTAGNEQVAPLRLNPFELVEGELISSHIDMLKATFTSAFPMEASMPQLLEEAMYSCYEALGWDVNEYYYGEFPEGVTAFPQLSDLLKAMEIVVKEKNFDARLQNDYIGSLVSRLSNLTKGAKGRMLNCPRSTDFDELAESKVILELEDIKSAEEKALLMGLFLGRMEAVIRNRSTNGITGAKANTSDERYKHLTLVEEAHRLLSKVEYGDSGAKKVAVETFTDLLAEVRKYGEGLIIADQIPNKLASEVLKNTNTKIIHRILAKDDKEAVGDTMLMDDKQKEFLSALEAGQAIIFSDCTDSPVNVQVRRATDTSEDEVNNQSVKERFLHKKNKLGKCYSEADVTPFMKDFNQLGKWLTGSEKEVSNRWEQIQKKWQELKALLEKTCSDEKKFEEILRLMVYNRYVAEGYRYMEAGGFSSGNKSMEKIIELYKEFDTFKEAKDFQERFFEISGVQRRTEM